MSTNQDFTGVDQADLLTFKKQAYAMRFEQSVYESCGLKENEALALVAKKKAIKLAAGAAESKEALRAPLSPEDMLTQASDQLEGQTRLLHSAERNAGVMRRTPELFQNELSAMKQEILRLNYLIEGWSAEVARLKALIDPDLEPVEADDLAHPMPMSPDCNPPNVPIEPPLAPPEAKLTYRDLLNDPIEIDAQADPDPSPVVRHGDGVVPRRPHYTGG